MTMFKLETMIYASDSGREGELIFRLVYQQAGCKKPVSRLWLSSMEEKCHPGRIRPSQTVN